MSAGITPILQMRNGGHSFFFSPSSLESTHLSWRPLPRFSPVGLGCLVIIKFGRPLRPGCSPGEGKEEGWGEVDKGGEDRKDEA